MCVVGFIDFLDGSEIKFSSFLPAIIKEEMELDDFMVSLLGSVSFVGSFLGAISAGVKKFIYIYIYWVFI